MDEQKLKRIQEFLAKQGKDMSVISKSRLKQLSIVDDAIQKKINNLSEAKETIKNSRINISNISNETQIARKTFYNNELLRLYVESNSEIDDEKNVSESEFTRLKEKYDIQNQQIKDLLLKDIETESLRQDNEILEREISNLQNHNKALENQLEELHSKLSIAHKNLNEQNIRVVDFSRKSQ